MPVFISHRTADDAIAQHVHRRLTTVHNILCYLDDFDRVPQRSLTEHIVTRIKECTNLLALVTPNTKGSWWVPFEVGVARLAPRIISSFTNLEQRDLPEYLTEWPVLRGDNAIDTFAQYYKTGAQVVKKAFLEKREDPSVAVRGIEDFHRQLKAALRQ